MGKFWNLLLLLVLNYYITSSEEVITINPGDNIQSAIDKLHNNYNGGSVLFNKGTYTISKTLQMYSNIALLGNPTVSNKDIIIRCDPSDLKFNQAFVSYADNYNISNVAFINLQFLGNIQRYEQNYPPCCHTDPSNCTVAPPLYNCSTARDALTAITGSGCGDSLETACNYNLTFKDLIISHCSMGIAIGGWRMVLLENIETFNNGMIQTFYHNIYLRRDYNITLNNVISHDSPTGNGINLSQGGYITAYHSNFYNNYWRGFRIYGEEGYIVHNINVHNITCVNNSDYGFLFANIINGVVYDNVAKQSGNQNEHDANCKNVSFHDNDWSSFLRMAGSF